MDSQDTPTPAVEKTNTKTKKIVAFALKRSVATTVSHLIKQNLTYETKLAHAEHIVGGYLLGEIVADRANAQIEQLSDAASNVVAFVSSMHQKKPPKSQTPS